MQTIDFNSLSRPMVLLVMRDAAKTQIHLTVPTVGLVERLKANIPTLQQALNGEENELRPALYDLAADLINCNLDAIRVSGGELAGQYAMTMADLVAFFDGYTNFLTEVEHTKN